MTTGASELKNIGLTLLVLIVLVIALLTLFPSMREKAIGSMDGLSDFVKESFSIGTKVFSEDVRQDTVVQSMSVLLDNVTNCQDTMCDLTRGTIYQDHIIHVYNQDPNLGLLAQASDDTLLADEIQVNLQLGLLTVKEEEKHTLGCIFPEYYQIKTRDSTDSESWYISLDGKEYNFYDLVDYHYVGETFNFKIQEIYNIGDKCLLTEFIEQEYSGNSEFIPISDIDFSEQINEDETELSTDMVFRFLSLEGVYVEEEWQVNPEATFPIEYTCCSSYEERDWISQLGTCEKELDIEYCFFDSEVFSLEKYPYYDTILVCESDTNTPRNLLSIELSSASGKNTLICNIK